MYLKAIDPIYLLSCFWCSLLSDSCVKQAVSSDRMGATEMTKKRVCAFDQTQMNE